MEKKDFYFMYSKKKKRINLERLHTKVKYSVFGRMLNVLLNKTLLFLEKKEKL